MSDTGFEKEFEREVLDRLIKIESKLESWDNSKKQIYDNQNSIIHLQEKVDQCQNDIQDLQERNKWLSRTCAGAVVTAVISALIAAVLVIP